ncbi:recombinase family protein [Gordonia sp. (in: high G+C Gram-positive bacteria)]|uniref:recombinase family protein n=1 Tax=Gordonia sp. (in: high G+C Gram-positive bacteria) TaxID=84139 RepID=UPI0035293E93
MESASGAAGSTRPVWTECAAWLRPGDVLVVVGIDRLGRSVAEVASVIAELAERGVVVRALREGIDTSTPSGRMTAAILAPVAEMELGLGRERRAASRAARVARSLPATRPRRLTTADDARLVRLRDQGEPVDELVALFGVSRSTVRSDSTRAAASVRAAWTRVGGEARGGVQSGGGVGGAGGVLCESHAVDVGELLGRPGGAGALPRNVVGLRHAPHLG